MKCILSEKVYFAWKEVYFPPKVHSNPDKVHFTQKKVHSPQKVNFTQQKSWNFRMKNMFCEIVYSNFALTAF